MSRNSITPRGNSPLGNAPRVSRAPSAPGSRRAKTPSISGETDSITWESKHALPQRLILPMRRSCFGREFGVRRCGTLCSRFQRHLNVPSSWDRPRMNLRDSLDETLTKNRKKTVTKPQANVASILLALIASFGLLACSQSTESQLNEIRSLRTPGSSKPPSFR